MIRIGSYARLNFGLIDLSKAPFRVDGSSGLAVNIPAAKIEMKKSDQFKLQLMCDNKERCETVVERCIEKIDGRKFSLKVESFIDAHVGLGSGTQIAMAIVMAFNEEYQLRMSLDEMANLAGSGGTSNIGVYSFLHGGFNLDSGRLFPEEKSESGPGEQFTFSKLSPLLLRMDMPKWYLCIVIPKTKDHICDIREKKLFQEYTPIVEEEVNVLCKHLLTGVLPSIKTQCFPAFCRSMEQCMRYGFKKKEIGSYGELIYDTFLDLKSKGAGGVGMSSFGPAVFGFYETYDEAKKVYEELKSSYLYDKVYLTTPRNQGALIRR